MQATRKRKSRKVKKHTRMSIEIQRLKDQLYDDKNFIFNSQNQFGFTSQNGYNFHEAKFKKHQRGIGNNRLVLKSMYDRDTLKEIIAQNTTQSRTKGMANYYMSNIETSSTTPFYPQARIQNNSTLAKASRQASIDGK